MSAHRDGGEERAGEATTTVPAAERTLRIFEAFQRGIQPMTLSRLASEIDAPISSCHNLVRTLTSRGYLYSLESQRTYYPTRKLWELASTIVAHDPVLERILSTVEQLRDESAETVIVGKRQDGAILYLLVLEGSQTIRYVAKPGHTIPMHTSAIGKALLGTLSDAELDTWLNTRKLKAVTKNSIVDPASLGEEIRAGRSRGYQVTAGENVDDVGAISMTTQIGGENMAIAVAGPTERIAAKRDEIVTQLNKAVAKLSSTLR